MTMKNSLHALIATFSLSAIAEEHKATNYYYQLNYNLNEVTKTDRLEALETLSSIREFRRLQGLVESCGTLYHLTDETEHTVGYGSICKTAENNLKGFFCWDVAGQYFGYATRPQGASSVWMADSILHGCGGALVPVPDYRDKVDNFEIVPTLDGWALPDVDWGDTRPVETMLDSDLERLGFDIDPRCEKIRLLNLGPDGNEYYAATCKIDHADNQAVICFGTPENYFGLFTRYRDTSKWAELTLYRFCWGE